LDNKTEVARWNFTNAWPTRWDGPSLNIRGNEVATETLVLAHEGLTRV
jgi:phage tail-like protein